MAKIRTTIVIEEEALEAYREHARALGVSLSRAAGGWLEESADAVRMVTRTVAKAKAGPAEALRGLVEVMERAERDAGALKVEAEGMLGPARRNPRTGPAGRPAVASAAAAGQSKRVR